MERKKSLDRRGFLKSSAFCVLGAGVAMKNKIIQAEKGLSSDKDSSFPSVKKYRTLGRTGFKVSDIGAGSIQDRGVLGTALDAGVNYIDTAEEYPGHHKVVGEAIKGRDRESIFITTKLQIKKEKTKQGFLRRARKCLQELDTEYVDCIMIHMAETAETLKTPGFHQAMDELKAEGRVRFVGVSNHGSFWFRDPEETMEKVLLSAAEDGRFDVFLMAYNFLKMDQSEKVLKVCRQKNIGTAIMKATPVAIYYNLKSSVERMQEENKEVNPLYTSGLKRYKDKIDRAEDFIERHELGNPEEIKKEAIKFVLDNPNVSTVCCLAKTYTELEQFLLVSGSRLTVGEREKLSQYEEGCGDLYCRHACGLCEPECPHGVPINTILRYNHYFRAQGREREAIQKYAAIPGSNAEACKECPGFCEKACPFQIPVQGMLLAAHEFLSL
ncbi:MAG: aldo/keto reductase [Acidobacteriota bacterium]